MDSRSVFRIAGALALALLLVLPAAAADPGRIAFVSDRDGNLEIYVMDADGSDPVRLTNDGAADFYPAWSPDGSRIAFVSSREREPNQSPNLHIFTMRPDGTDVARLNESLLFDTEPAWSPDGTRIAFRGGFSDIWVVNADGSDPVGLTFTSDSDAFFYAWSPDGSRIAYANCTWSPVHSTAIWTIRADGTGRSPLGPVVNGWGFGLAWSPDGTRIAYTRQDLGIYLVNADGSGDAAIPGGNAGDCFPSWSPDGTRIAFSSGGDILAMDPDGSNRTTLHAGAGNNSEPVWGVAYPPAPPLVPVAPCPDLPTDPDGDGVHDDVNGNGRADFADVVLYFDALDWIADHEPIGAFDCNGNGRIDFADVVRLFNGL